MTGGPVAGRNDFRCAGCGATHPYIPYGYSVTPTPPEDRGPVWFRVEAQYLPAYRGHAYRDPRGPGGYVPGCDVWVCSVPCLTLVAEELTRFAEEVRDEYMPDRQPALGGQP